MKNYIQSFKSAIAFLLCISMLPATPVLGSTDTIENATESFEAATYLIDCYPTEIPLTANNNVDLLSGWDIDRRGGQFTTKRGGNICLLDESEELPVAIERAIDEQSYGVLTLETGLMFSDMTDGFSFRFYGNDKRVIEFVTEKGFLCYVTENGNKAFYRPEEEVAFALKAVIDLDNKKAELFIDGKFIEEIVLDGGFDVLNGVKMTTPADKMMNMYFSFMRLYKNYLINERFISVAEGNLPHGWEVTSNEKDTVAAHNYGTGNDFRGLRITDKSVVDKSVVKKEFVKECSKIAFTMQYLIPERKDNISFSLNNGKEAVVTMKTNGENMVYNNGALRHTYNENLWQTFRIEVDLESKQALIKHNGKKVDVIDLNTNAKTLDSFSISTSINGKSEFYVDDVYVMPIVEYDDYPSEPVIPKDSKDYKVGMMQCSLWRDGTAYGWDTISAHEERIPYLGFYDEGKPEVSDWELKWMAEHGVDFQAMCWYLPGSYTGGPLKGAYGAAVEALHEGYFNAKYSDYVDFALLVCATPPNQKAWREHMVPYWIEYYFKDERYLKIDNKPVIYTFADFANALGGTDKAKIEFDYLRDELKKHGFDGAILVAQAASAGEHAKLIESGYDAVYRYNWGMQSYKADTQIKGMEAQYGDDLLPVSATVSMGYNQAAWRKGTDVPYCDPEVFEDVLEWARDEFMPRYGEDEPMSKVVSLANWNEYGEGHFMMPSSLHGFDYLDKIRNVFTDGEETHTDVKPTENQLVRLRGLFPEDKRMVRYIPDLNESYPTKVLKGWYFNNPDDADEWKIEKQVDALNIVDGKLTGKTIGVDGGIVLKSTQNIPITDVAYIRIKMKDSVHEGRTEIFFTTDTDAAWAQNKSAQCDVAGEDGINTYYFRLDTNAKWKGKMDKLRFDMTNKINTEFAIQSIELMENDNKYINMSIDNEQMKFDFSPENKDGNIFVPLVPFGGWHEKFAATAKWTHSNQALTIYTDKVNMVFTVGSKVALVNGVETELPSEVYMKNNLPMVPIRFVAEKLGATIAWDAEKYSVNITIPKKEVVVNTEPVERIPYEWEFNVNDDKEGFTFSGGFSRVRVKDGILTLKSTSNDPMFVMNNISMDTNTYRFVTIRMKNTTTSGNLQIFFTSDETGAQSEANSVRYTIKKQDSEYTEYVVDMLSNENWKGTITSLRIDPVSAKGTVEIDYIRVTE